jgi:hypothetical protein
MHLERLKAKIVEKKRKKEEIRVVADSISLATVHRSPWNRAVDGHMHKFGVFNSKFGGFSIDPGHHVSCHHVYATHAAESRSSPCPRTFSRMGSQASPTPSPSRSS